MIFLKGLAGAGVALEERAVKPLYGRVQATPQTRLFADKAKCPPACLPRCAYLPDRSGLFLLNRIIRC